MRVRLKGRFLRGVIAISGGTAIGQAALLASAPLLSRLYSPTEFAVLTVVTSCAMPLAMVLSLRFESAIQLPQNDDESRGLAQVALTLSAIFTVILCGALLIFDLFGFSLLAPLGLGNWVYAVPVLALVLAWYRTLMQWTLRRQAYRAVGLRNIALSFSTIGAQVAGGLRGLGAAGLVLGYVAGQLVGVLLLVRGSQVFAKVQYKRVKRVLPRYSRFALTLTPSGLINSLGVYAPAVFLTAMYGPVVGGSFGFAQRILFAPVTLLGQSMSQVYLAEVTDIRRRESGNPRRLFYRSTLWLGGAGILVALIIGLGAPWIFQFAFGEVWREAGVMASVLAVQVAAQLVASPLSQTLIAYEKSGWQLAWDVSRLVSVALVFGSAAALNLGPIACLVVFSAVSTILYIISWVLSRRALHLNS